MNIIYIKIYADSTRYDRLIVSPGSVNRYHSTNTNSRKNEKVPHSPQCSRLKLNGVVVHCLIQEIRRCAICRCMFIGHILMSNNAVTRTLRISLEPLSTCPDTIDHNWNEKVNLMLRERCELDHALSWLSTLGGAFSALGDYFANCAETAAKISMHQFQLALRLNDPAIAARCRLYFALSLIQRKRYKFAKSLIAREYEVAKMSIVMDERLLKMCKGIWAKLKYEWDLHRRYHKSIKFEK